VGGGGGGGITHLKVQESKGGRVRESKGGRVVSKSADLQTFQISRSNSSQLLSSR